MTHHTTNTQLYKLGCAFNSDGEMVYHITRKGDADFLVELVDAFIAREVLRLLEEDAELYHKANFPHLFP